METYSRLFFALTIGIIFGFITSEAPYRKVPLQESYQERLAKNRRNTSRTLKKIKISQTNKTIKTTIDHTAQAKKYALEQRSNRYKKTRAAKVI